MSSFRLAAIGDGLIGPLIYSGRGKAGVERTFIDNRFVNWLRVILPEVEIADDAVLGFPGANAVEVARRATAVLDADSAPDAVLICAGTEDCLAAIRGTSPEPAATVAALETIATACLATGVTPVFVIPPPCALFGNGLFADRFVAIAATLRRMHQRDPRVHVVDSTLKLMRPGAFGVEPEPLYVAAGTDGRLSSLGAFRLAELTASTLQQAFAGSIGAAPRFEVDGALNANPRLTGSNGTIAAEATTGRCATGYRLQVHATGGVRVRVTESTGRRGEACRLSFTGRYTTAWGFVQLDQNIDASHVASLSAGDMIEAACDFALLGPVENIAAVSLHATAVWVNDFAGLHSSLYVGGPGLAQPHSGRLLTPCFKLPQKPTKLHVSCKVHLIPGADLVANGKLELKTIVLRKVPSVAAHRSVRFAERAAKPEVRSAV